MAHSTDILIVGGGIIGLTSARCLRQRGLRVTILERGVVGREASWAAAGLLAPQCESEALDAFFDLCRASLALYPAFAGALSEASGIDVGYRTEGTLVPALSDRDQQDLERRQALQQAAGLPVVRLSAREARRLEPNLSGDIHMALLFPEDHQVDNRKLVEALNTVLRQEGVEIHEHTTVTKLLTEGARVIGVEANGEAWYAETVLNAAGSWAGYLNRVPGGARLPVRPVRGQMLALDVTDAPPFQRVIYSSKGYLVPKGDGRLLVGSTVEEAGFRNTATIGGMLKLMSGAIQIAPILRDYPIASIWSGLRPAVPDRHPVLGPTGVEGYVVATAHFRNGILLAPLTGQLMTEVIVDGAIPALMQPFLPARFHQTPE